MTLYIYINPQASPTHIRDPRDLRRTIIVYPKSHKHVPEGGVTEVTSSDPTTFTDEIKFGQLVLKSVIVPVATIPLDVKLDVTPSTSGSDLFPTPQTPLDSVRIEDDSRVIAKQEPQRTIEIKPITVAVKHHAPPVIPEDEVSDEVATTVIDETKKLRRRRRK